MWVRDLVSLVTTVLPVPRTEPGTDKYFPKGWDSVGKLSLSTPKKYLEQFYVLMEYVLVWKNPNINNWEDVTVTSPPRPNISIHYPPLAIINLQPSSFHHHPYPFPRFLGSKSKPSYNFICRYFSILFFLELHCTLLGGCTIIYFIRCLVLLGASFISLCIL